MLVSAASLFSAWLMFRGYQPDVDPSRPYYSTDTHFFGIGFGVAAALILTFANPSIFTPLWRPVASSSALYSVVKIGSVIASAGLLLAVALLPDTSPQAYQGAIALASLVVAIILSSIALQCSPLTPLLQLPVLRWIGVRSYSIYLWHWPVFILADYLITSPTQRSERIVPALAIVLTLLCSAWSYRWMERPFLDHGFAGVWKRIFARPALHILVGQWSRQHYSLS